MTAGPRTLFGTVATLTGAGKREQTVFTPNAILNVPRALWGGRIAYDPCQGHPGHVLTSKGRALAKSGLLSPCWDQYPELAVPVESQVNAVSWTDTRGLVDPWPDHTFANSPYDKLVDWLAWSLEQPSDHIMLAPIRPHRVWWREWARESEVVYLNPVTFVGHDQSFPAPVCLARRNPEPYRGEMTAMCEALGLGEAI